RDADGVGADHVHRLVVGELVLEVVLDAAARVAGVVLGLLLVGLGGLGDAGLALAVLGLHQLVAVVADGLLLDLDVRVAAVLELVDVRGGRRSLAGVLLPAGAGGGGVAVGAGGDGAEVGLALGPVGLLDGGLVAVADGGGPGRDVPVLVAGHQRGAVRVVALHHLHARRQVLLVLAREREDVVGGVLVALRGVLAALLQRGALLAHRRHVDGLARLLLALGLGGGGLELRVQLGDRVRALVVAGLAEVVRHRAAQLHHRRVVRVGLQRRVHLVAAEQRGRVQEVRRGGVRQRGGDLLAALVPGRIGGARQRLHRGVGLVLGGERVAQPLADLVHRALAVVHQRRAVVLVAVLLELPVQLRRALRRALLRGVGDAGGVGLAGLGGGDDGLGAEELLLVLGAQAAGVEDV